MDSKYRSSDIPVYDCHHMLRLPLPIMTAITYLGIVLTPTHRYDVVQLWLSKSHANFAQSSVFLSHSPKNKTEPAVLAQHHVV